MVLSTEPNYQNQRTINSRIKLTGALKENDFSRYFHGRMEINWNELVKDAFKSSTKIFGDTIKAQK